MVATTAVACVPEPGGAATTSVGIEANAPPRPMGAMVLTTAVFATMPSRACTVTPNAVVLLPSEPDAPMVVAVAPACVTERMVLELATSSQPTASRQPNNSVPNCVAPGSEFCTKFVALPNRACPFFSVIAARVGVELPSTNEAVTKSAPIRILPPMLNAASIAFVQPTTRCPIHG